MLTDVWPGVRIFASHKLCMPREALAGLQIWLTAYIKASANPAIDRLPLIPCAMLDFIDMSPFAKGSVRMSLLLGALLFCLSGIRPEVVCVLLQILRDMKVDMGIAVAEFCRAEREKILNVWPFVRTVLSALQSSLGGLAALVETMGGRLGPALQNLEVPLARPEAPYDRVKDYAQRTQGCFIAADVLDACPGLERPAVNAALKRLQEEGCVVRRGTGRGTRCEASDEWIARS